MKNNKLLLHQKETLKTGDKEDNVKINYYDGNGEENRSDALHTVKFDNR